MALVLVLGGGVAASGVVLEREVGTRPVAGAATGSPRTGAWLCPHGGHEGWDGWVVVLNPTDVEAAIAVTELSSEAVAEPRRETVAPRSQRYLPVSAVDPSSSTLVEYFGTQVVVSSVLVDERERTVGAGASACSRAGGSRWLSADATTVVGRDYWLVVMNPYAEDASFDVTLTSPGEVLNPGEMQGFVLPPRRSAAFHLNEFRLDEEAIATRLETGLGKVAVGLLGVAKGDGLTQTVAVPGVAASGTAPAASDAGVAGGAIYNPEGERADVELRAQGPAAQALVEGFEEVSLGPGEVRSFIVDLEEPGLGLSATATRGGFVLARRADGQKGDIGATEAATPASRWAVPASAPEDGGTSSLVLENPTPSSVTVSIRLFGEDGEIDAPDPATVELAPGTTTAVPLGASDDDGPVGALVEAGDGAFVAASVSYSLGGLGFAMALGAPLSR